MISPRAVIFDLDGTLLDNSDLVIEIYYNGMRELGYEPKNREYIRSILGQSTFKTGSDLGLKEKDLPAIDTYFWTHFGKSAHDEKYYPKIYPGVRELLELLFENKIPTAICTGNKAEFARILMKKAGLDSFITSYVGAEDVTNQKPDPEPVFTALKKLNVAKEQVINKKIWYIGDTPSDMKAAKNAGIFSIGIPEKDKIEVIKKLNPDTIYESMVALYNYTKDALGKKSKGNIPV